MRSTTDILLYKYKVTERLKQYKIGKNFNKYLLEESLMLYFSSSY